MKHEIDIDDLSEKEKMDFKQNMSFFFSEIVGILDTFETDKQKIDWIKEMDSLFKENIV